MKVEVRDWTSIEEATGTCYKERRKAGHSRKIFTLISL
jgi:hypothetical protein